MIHLTQHFSRSWTIRAQKSHLISGFWLLFNCQLIYKFTSCKMKKYLQFYFIFILLLRPPRFGPGPGVRIRIFFIILKQRVPTALYKTYKQEVRMDNWNPSWGTSHLSSSDCTVAATSIRFADTSGAQVGVFVFIAAITHNGLYYQEDDCVDVSWSVKVKTPSVSRLKTISESLLIISENTCWWPSEVVKPLESE